MNENERDYTIGLDWLEIGYGAGVGTNTNNDDITKGYN